MSLREVFEKNGTILMEGAISERLKNEFNVVLDKDIAIAAAIIDPKSKVALEFIFNQYIGIAEKYDLPLMLTTPTRRANQERIEKSKFDDSIIEENVNFLRALCANSTAKIFVGGLMGCKGDAYNSSEGLNREESIKFHRWQAQRLYRAGVDYLYAGIMPSLEEAIGMAKAMEETGLPYIISFMLAENGCLLDGTKLSEAIMEIDLNTKLNPLCFMCNCIHPKRIKATLQFVFNRDKWVLTRFLGVQVNTSELSPSDLEKSGILRTCKPIALANDIDELEKYMTLKIIGGCCGTNQEHIEEIAKRIYNKRLELV